MPLPPTVTANDTPERSSMPQDVLFDTVRTEPRLDLFVAYLSGRLLDDDFTAQLLVDIYDEWRGFTQ